MFRSVRYAGNLFNNTRCPVRPVAHNDQFTVKTIDGPEELPDTVFLVVRGDDDAAGKGGCGVHGIGNQGMPGLFVAWKSVGWIAGLLWFLSGRTRAQAIQYV